jgi:serine protease Do
MMATQMAADLSTLAETLHRATVQVRGQQSGVGSGVIWQSDGMIVTNAHVIQRDTAIVELFDGRTFTATVTARDAQQDLAILTVDAIDLPAAAIADSDSLRVGELVVAMGNPLGMTGALTLGIIHAVDPASRQQSWIQADIHLAPGNSGGPLANAQGRVIGINSMIANGLGIAIPSNTVEQFLQRRGAPWRLGVTLQPVQIYFEGDRTLGWVILDIEPGSVAETLELLIGDTLIGVAGRRFRRPRDLNYLLRHIHSGMSLQLDILRAGQLHSRQVDWDDRPQTSDAA